ncbi:calcium/sodium antiporter [Desulfoplanes sp.]
MVTQIGPDIILVLVSAALLWLGANWIVDSAAAIARKFNLSELVIGLTVVAFGTSAPEFLVSATAAFKELGDISLSNIVGSNIFNLGLILGLMAMIKPIRTHPTLVYRDGVFLWTMTILVTLFSLDLYMGRAEGTVLLGLLIGYITFLIFRGQKELSGLDLPSQRAATWKDYPTLVAGFVCISLGGHFMVDSASSLAEFMGVSKWVIGVTIVAAGTSLPELITCLAATFRGKNDMLLGNLLGSDFFNFAGVLGMTCILRPLEISPTALPSLYALVSMVFLVLVFMRSGWRVGRVEGALLILINLGRWTWDFMG